MSLLVDLSFVTAWRWPISAKFSRVTVVSKVLSSYRFHADQQQSCSTFSLLAEGGAAVWALLWIPIQREGEPKSHKGACSSWGEASCHHWASFIKSLLFSPGSQSWDLQAEPGELLAGRARPCSLHKERGLTHYSSGTQFCYLCFGGRW